MKRFVLGLAALALVLPAGVMAQVPSVPGTIELAVAGGASVPMGDFGDIAGTGYGFGANGTYYFTPAWGVGANIVYNTYGFDEAVLSDYNMTIWEFAAHGKYMFSQGMWAPYGKAALGWFRGSTDVTGESVSSTDMGIAGGLGLQWNPPTGNVGVFGECMYNNIFTDGTSTNYVSFRAGVNFDIIPTP
jgi:hypothetical protein